MAGPFRVSGCNTSCCGGTPAVDCYKCNSNTQATYLLSFNGIDLSGYGAVSADWATWETFLNGTEWELIQTEADPCIWEVVDNTPAGWDLDGNAVQSVKVSLILFPVEGYYDWWIEAYENDDAGGNDLGGVIEGQSLTVDENYATADDCSALPADMDHWGMLPARYFSDGGGAMTVVLNGEEFPGVGV